MRGPRVAVVYDAIAYGGHRAQFDWSDPDAHPRGLTGTDLIAVKFAENLSLRGHDVSVYCHGATMQAGRGGFDVFPIEALQHALDHDARPFDIALAISSPNELHRFPATTLRMVNRQVAKFCWPDVPKDFDDCVDVYLCPSAPARDHVAEGLPHPEKFEVLPNGCDPDHFGKVEKTAGRVVYCSSPDRGLHLLLSVWPQIKALVPEATLRIAYQSIDAWLAHHTNPENKPDGVVGRECVKRATYIKHALPRLRHLGVEVVGGGMSHRDIERTLDEAMVLGFPVTTLAFTETFSVATLEACAAGAIPVVSSCDSIGHIYRDSGAVVLQHPVHARMGEFVDAVVRALRDESFRAETVAKTRAFAAEHSWDKLTERLEQIIERHCAKRYSRELEAKGYGPPPPDKAARSQQTVDEILRQRGIEAGTIAKSWNREEHFLACLDADVSAVGAPAEPAKPAVESECVRVHSTRKPIIHLVLDRYGSGPEPIDLDNPSGDSGGGCRAGFVGLAKALGARGDYEVVAYSNWRQPSQYAGVPFHQSHGVVWKHIDSFSPFEKRDALLAYYNTQPLVGVTGCLRIASHHTLVLPWPAAQEWTDVNVAPSPDAMTKLRDVYDTTAPWYVLPNAVGDMPIPEGTQRVPGRVIYHTSPSRGLHHLVEMWPEIRRRVPHATLHVVGDVAGWLSTFKGRKCRQGERAERLRKALAAAEVQSRTGHGDDCSVFFLGKLPRKDLLRELGEASCFAFPCDTITPCETFSVSVMECLKIGLPVVLRPSDSLRSIYGDHVVCRNEMGLFADAVGDVLFDKDGIAYDYARAGRAFAAEFTFEASATALHEILQRHLPATSKHTNGTTYATAHATL